MQKLNILNSREVKKIREMALAEYGYFLEKDYAYLLSEGKNKLFIINKDLARVDLNKLKVDKLGLYFGEIKGNSLRLSKEGAQILFKEAEKNKKKLKNVVELDNSEMKKYFEGLDLDKSLGDEARFVLLKYKKDVFGCAKYKEGKILNFLPKIHRGEVIL